MKLVSDGGNRRPDLLLVAIVAVSALMRLVALDSFPEVEADEGLWTNSSKNYVMFGDWFMDGRTHMLLSPVFHALSVAVFRVLGAGIAHARLISAVAGTVSVLLLFLLVRRLTGSREWALVAATLFGVSEWAVLLSRRALIEPLQLVWILAAAVVLMRPGLRSAVLAGGLFALALLTKINVAFLLPVFALLIWFDWGRAVPPTRARRIGHVLCFTGTAVAVAGLAYLALYRLHPDLFVRAFTFELEGQHFGGADPLVRVGRFGFDPFYASRTILELFREDPVFMVLSALGVAIAIATRPRNATAFALWGVAGTGFVLIQLFQPLRYLYLAVPAFAYFAALPILAIGNASAARVQVSRPAFAALAMCVMFEIGYITINGVTNRAVKLPVVREWARATLDADDRVLAAGYLSTDLPVRVYAHYHLAGTPQQLLENIKKYEISYVLYDYAEWRPELGRVLADHYEPVATWPFGVVYRVERVDAGSAAVR